MKLILRILLVSSCLAGLGNAATAQTMPPRKGAVKPASQAKAPTGVGVKDGLIMKEGHVILTELGITGPITTEKKLVNGTTISPTGLVTSTTGTTTQLGEGDTVSLTGRVTSHASIAEADSLLKIKQFDLKYPGKREKMAKAQAEKDKAKKERDEAKAKLAKEKAERDAKAKKH